MSHAIPFLRPSLPAIDLYAPYLAEIDENHWYSNFGPINTRLESRLKHRYFNDKGAVATVANCTLGLMLALSAIKRPQGKYVVMPSFTFAATPLSAIWSGLTPYFVDVNESDWVSSKAAIDDALKLLGDDVAAVIVYNTFGTAIDLAPLADIHNSGVPVIVDAAPSFGARTEDDQPFGMGFPGVVAFSFHATKPFGIGEGGLVYSANVDTVERIRQLSNFGFDTPGITSHNGLNAKLPEISAAVGLAVYEDYPNKMERLNSIFQLYQSELDLSGLFGLGLERQHTAGVIPYQFVPLLIPDSYDVGVIEAGMSACGIGVRRYFMPSCHDQVAMRELPRGDLTVTEKISGQVMCLPLWDGLTDEQVRYIVSSFRAQFC